MEVDFYKSIPTQDKTIDLQKNLDKLLSKVLKDKKTSKEKKKKVARLLAYVRINLENF
jgi:cell division protein FtsL